MALKATDIEIIKATWLCVRQDNVSSGCLLFKQLFTRYPQYLQLFPRFPDLDLEHMRENKRLLKHAVGVIDIVSYVVDALGDEKQTSSLNEALLNLIKSHLRRKIGLDKFRNLGDVLIDFICELNHMANGSKLDNSTEPNIIDTTTTTTTVTTNSTTPANQQDTTTNQQLEQSIDTKSLRSAWAKLYDIILSLVESEEAAIATATATQI